MKFSLPEILYKRLEKFVVKLCISSVGLFKPKTRMYSKIVFSAIFLSLAISINAQCNCGNYIGVHCGERATDGTNGLKGTCNPDIIYQCPAANVAAQSKGYCSYCAKAERLGTDYCSIGRKGKLENNLKFYFSN
jgi:hypothetical protein